MNVPNATMTNAAAKTITIAEENSLTVGVGDGEAVAEGNVTVLLVGMKKACTATSWSTTNESELSVEVVPPLA